MRAYLADLIDRMAKDEPMVSSANSVSWAAYREAEGLRDVDMVDELVGLGASDKEKSRRAACHFIIGKIGGNVQDSRCARVLLDLLKTERDKHNIASILERVAEISKPSEFDLSPVYALLEDARSRVRHAAIQALNNSLCAEVETRLLRHLASTDEPYDQVYCHSVLNRLGTARSIPQLEANLQSRKRDVKQSAKAAIGAIRSRNGV